MQPSRRPQATAFQPVGGGNNNNTNEDRFGGLQVSSNNNNNNNRRNNTTNNNNNTTNSSNSNSQQSSPHNSNNVGHHQNNNNNKNVQNNKNKDSDANAAAAAAAAANLDPASFSVTIRGNDMSDRMGTFTNKLMAQLKILSSLRDTFLNERENFVSQKICTLARQLESLFSESSEILTVMQNEQHKTMPHKGLGRKNEQGVKAEEENHPIQHQQPPSHLHNTKNETIVASSSSAKNDANSSNSNNGGVDSLLGNLQQQKQQEPTPTSPTSILNMLHQHQQQNTVGGGNQNNNNNNVQNHQQNNNNNNTNNAARGSRRPVAVPFGQQQQNQNNNNSGNDTPPSSGSSAPPVYLPGVANLDLNNTNNNTANLFQQNNNNNNHQQFSGNDTNSGFRHHQPPPPPPPPASSQNQNQNQQQQQKFVRAQTVITQAEQQNDKHGDLSVPQPNNNGTSASISAHQANLQGLNANGEQTFPANPHRRLNRGEAHHFCVIEFKCNRMKRYPFDKSIDNVRPGHYVICWGDKGEDCGLCVMTGFCDEAGAHSDIKTFKDANVELHKVRILSDVFILRNASRDEVATLHGSLAKLEEAALQRCQEMSAQRQLNMRFTDCEIQFDRQKFTFYFDAGSSVDFRDLTRDLHRIFKARIWLENINGNVKNVVPEGAISQSDKKMFAARGVQLKFR